LIGGLIPEVAGGFVLTQELVDLSDIAGELVLVGATFGALKDSLGLGCVALEEVEEVEVNEGLGAVVEVLLVHGVGKSGGLGDHVEGGVVAEEIGLDEAVVGVDDHGILETDDAGGVVTHGGLGIAEIDGTGEIVGVGSKSKFLGFDGLGEVAEGVVVVMAEDVEAFPLANIG
jgi:hypothetical protein